MRLGSVMGGKNHATVIHGIKRVNDYLESVDGFKAKVDAATDQLAS